MNKKIKIIFVVGARPNFIKIAPLLKEIKNYSHIKSILVHTGQHYDDKMSAIFFKDLNIKKPDYNLNIGGGSHGFQTGNIMIAFEKICLKEKPNLIVVVGDVNSTLACALVAVKLCIKIAHIEAGLRSFDKSMPEEINRIITDQISDYLFITEESAKNNLLKEGISSKKIFFTGNVMIDTLFNQIKSKNNNIKILQKLGIIKKQYSILTLHRPSNVDNKETLKTMLSVLNNIQQHIKIVWPIHPRAKNNINKFKLQYMFNKMKNIIIIEPLGYSEMAILVNNSKFVMTDSGGLQEETTALGIPCLTLRENTERPITIIQGTNILVGSNKNKIIKTVEKIINTKKNKSVIKKPKYWDGKTAKRIITILNKVTL